MTVDLSDTANAPTNPVFSDSLGALNNNRIFTAIGADDGDVFIPRYYKGVEAEYSNLQTTKGFRIKCYDALTQEGIQFDTPTYSFDLYYYFVLIYSDDDTKHHFARITEVITEDEEGDAFEFEPKLGNEIPKNTKFMIIQGHYKTGPTILAFSGGILQNSLSLDLANNLNCSRPLFYFFNDLLDKPDELNHNTKYYAMQRFGNAGSFTFNTTNAVVFRTVQDFGEVIKDYSKYSHFVSFTDKLRDLDDTTTGSITTNEGNTITATSNLYNKMFPNARREQDDYIAGYQEHTGPQRYLHYDFSPLKANLVYHVYDHINTESIDGKAGFSETSIIDNARILPKKIEEFYEYRVRDNIHQGDLDTFYPLKAKYKQTTSTNAFDFYCDYDLQTVLNTGDEVKIDDYIMLVSSFGGFSNNTQNIVFESVARLPTDALFASVSVSPSTDAVLYRRAYNAKDRTLMLDISLLNGRFSKMYIAFSALNFNGIFADITACDATKNMITLSYSKDSYNDSALNYLTGQYYLFVERFNGEVENIESTKEDGQTIMKIQGRDKFNKLLSPIINRNILFSQDVIYSSNSPYNKLSQIDSTNFSLDIGDTSLATGVNVADFDILPVAGNKLFTANGYIGEILTATGDPLTITLTRGALSQVYSEKIYVETEKNYILNKALSSSQYNSLNPTSLTGSANKGIIFTSGKSLTGSSETTELPNTSNSTNTEAIGYDILYPSSIDNDYKFQTRLSNTDLDTINTLIDFEIVSVNNNENLSEITLAPYIPITLGRKIANFENSESYTLTEIADLTTVGGANNTRNNILEATSDGIKNLNVGDAVFVGEDTESAVFAGYVVLLSMKRGTANNNNLVYLDRDFTYNLSIYKIFKADKDTHDLFFVNGAHLWNSKILTIPHPKITSSGAVPLNYTNCWDLDNTDISKKYGQPYYRLMSKSKGSFNLTRKKRVSQYSSFQTYPNTSKLKYSSIAYKFKPNINSDNKTFYDTTGTGDDIHADLDMRGFGSALGSLFQNLQRIRKYVASEDKYPNKTSAFVPEIDSLLVTLDQLNTPSATLFMYLNSDLLPYSSLRNDSLMDGNKTINSYNLFLLQEKEIIDESLNYSNTSSGKKLALSDKSFQTISFNSEREISSLKRFGIMRLTEICFDTHFNQYNPEKGKVKNENYLKGFSDFKGRTFTDLARAIDIASTLSANSDEIHITGSAISPAPTGELYDSNYQFIGIISSYSHPVITLQTDAYLNEEGTFTSGNLFVLDDETTIFTRGAKDDTFMQQMTPHIQKGAIITANYQTDTSNNWYSNNFSTTLSGVFSSSDVIATPIRFLYANTKSSLSSTIRQMPSRPIYQYFASSGNIFKQGIAVILDTYNIEDGNTIDIQTGTTVGLSGDAIKQADDGSFYTDFLTLQSGTHFVQYKYPDLTANTLVASGSGPYEATGIRFGIKPRFWFESGDHETVVTVKSSNGDLYRYGLDVFASQNAWIDMIDLTGCYLVSESGYNTITQTTITTGTESLNTGNSMHGVIPEEIIYIVSHEVANSTTIQTKNSLGTPVNAKKHIIITDKTLTDATAYRILKPNETTFYNFTPNEITLNMLSHGYTKMPNDNKMYDINQDIDILEGYKGDNGNGPRREGFLSMYVAVDVDKQSSNEDYLVIRKAKNFLDILPEGEHSLYLSDGDNKYSSSISVFENKDYTTEKEIGLKFSEIKEQHGIVSISEPFTITTVNTLNISPTRACIGTSLNIGLEGKDIINELMENEEISFSLDSNDDSPLYLSPNYQGVDLFSAINFVLNKKNMKLIEEDNVFNAVLKTNADYYTNILINDSDDYLISEFEKVSTLFDYYNEITVYGRQHKSVRKDLKSIQKRGRKSFDVIDESLLTQGETDKEASRLLRIHSTLNQKLVLTMHSKGISQLKVGDIIQVELPQENIPLSTFLVLEMKYNLSGFIKLTLGRYSKDLSDTLSGILISNRNTSASLRSKDLTSDEVSYDFLDTIKLKPLKLKIRKSTTSGGGGLGFTTPLNTGSQSLGFNGGTTTITDITEVDLTW